MRLFEPFQIPLHREARFPLERAALMRDPVHAGIGVPRGDGAPVMLIPGFLAGDPTLGAMARWLRDLGYRPCRAGIVANIDCTERTLVRLEQRLEAKADHHGRRVQIVGHSRGGVLGRILGVRRPDLVEGVVCLGSPLVDQFGIHPLVHAQVRATALLGSIGVPGLFSRGCLDGCCASAQHDALAPFPADVRLTSVYSRRDGIVAWRNCLDPAARHVEVDSTHCGMGVNRHVYRAVAHALRAEPATVVAHAEPLAAAA